MENLKIKCKTKEQSKQAQELFFELGGRRVNSSRIGMVAANDGVIYPDVIGNWDRYDGKEITLQELRYMVNQDQDEPFLTPETTLNDQYAEIEQVRKHLHYFKDVSNIDEIDVYAVLKLFDVTDPCLQHIVKKALCAGKRGHKDMMEDLQNIVDTAIRAVELNS